MKEKKGDVMRSLDRAALRSRLELTQTEPKPTLSLPMGRTHRHWRGKTGERQASISCEDNGVMEDKGVRE